MKDTLGRKINYLRLSVTDLCNLRCLYCMPTEGVPKLPHQEILSLEEIESIVRASVACGIDKVRITGGEPLVRKGILEICKRISAIPGVKELCITTNGVLLAEMAFDLRASGVDRLNISLDTLHPEKYASITRGGSLDTILTGLQQAKAAGFGGTKLNVVLIGGFNDDEIEDFVALTKDNEIQIRFIELMPMGACSHWPADCFLPADTVLKAAPALAPVGNQGVAKLYQVPGFQGTIGLISPISDHFCPTCNRIRVTADGKLKACLHSAHEVDLNPVPDEQLQAAIMEAIAAKPKSHHLTAASPSETPRSMFQIGG